MSLTAIFDLVFKNKSWCQFLDGVWVSTSFIGLFLKAGFNVCLDARKNAFLKQGKLFSSRFYFISIE
jgi:hypothetical protein